jgi:hypothetical protein
VTVVILREAAGVFLLFAGLMSLNVGLVVLVTGDVPGGLLSAGLGAVLTWGGARLSTRWRLVLGLVCLLFALGMLLVTGNAHDGAGIALAVGLAALYAIVGAVLVRAHVRAGRATPA